MNNIKEYCWIYPQLVELELAGQLLFISIYKEVYYLKEKWLYFE